MCEIEQSWTHNFPTEAGIYFFRTSPQDKTMALNLWKTPEGGIHSSTLGAGGQVIKEKLQERHPYAQWAGPVEPEIYSPTPRLLLVEWGNSAYSGAEKVTWEKAQDCMNRYPSAEAFAKRVWMLFAAGTPGQYVQSPYYVFIVTEDKLS
jgi:hypothetical protein